MVPSAWRTRICYVFFSCGLWGGQCVWTLVHTVRRGEVQNVPGVGDGRVSGACTSSWSICCTRDTCTWCPPASGTWNRRSAAATSWGVLTGATSGRVGRPPSRRCCWRLGREEWPRGQARVIGQSPRSPPTCSATPPFQCLQQRGRHSHLWVLTYSTSTFLNFIRLLDLIWFDLSNLSRANRLFKLLHLHQAEGKQQRQKNFFYVCFS